MKGSEGEMQGTEGGEGKNDEHKKGKWKERFESFQGRLAAFIVNGDDSDGLQKKLTEAIDKDDHKAIEIHTRNGARVTLADFDRAIDGELPHALCALRIAGKRIGVDLSREQRVRLSTKNNSLLGHYGDTPLKSLELLSSEEEQGILHTDQFGQIEDLLDEDGLGKEEGEGKKNGDVGRKFPSRPQPVARIKKEEGRLTPEEQLTDAVLDDNHGKILEIIPKIKREKDAVLRSALALALTGKRVHATYVLRKAGVELDDEQRRKVGEKGNSLLSRYALTPLPQLKLLPPDEEEKMLQADQAKAERIKKEEGQGGPTMATRGRIPLGGAGQPAVGAASPTEGTREEDKELLTPQRELIKAVINDNPDIIPGIVKKIGEERKETLRLALNRAFDGGFVHAIYALRSVGKEDGIDLSEEQRQKAEKEDDPVVIYYCLTAVEARFELLDPTKERDMWEADRVRKEAAKRIASPQPQEVTLPPSGGEGEEVKALARAKLYRQRVEDGIDNDNPDVIKGAVRSGARVTLADFDRAINKNRAEAMRALREAGGELSEEQCQTVRSKISKDFELLNHCALTSLKQLEEEEKSKRQQEESKVGKGQEGGGGVGQRDRGRLPMMPQSSARQPKGEYSKEARGALIRALTGTLRVLQQGGHPLLQSDASRDIDGHLFKARAEQFRKTLDGITGYLVAHKDANQDTVGKALIISIEKNADGDLGALKATFEEDFRNSDILTFKEEGKKDKSFVDQVGRNKKPGLDKNGLPNKVPRSGFALFK